MKFKLKNISIDFKSPLIPALLIILLMISGGFASLKNEKYEVAEFDITIHNQVDNHFVTHEYIVDALSKSEHTIPEGKVGSDLPLKEMESILLKNPYMSRAEIYRNLNGHLSLEVWLRRPMARIYTDKGYSKYLGNDGVLLATSTNYTSRVTLVTGPGSDSLIAESYWESPEGVELFELLTYVHKDEFLSSQIAEIRIEKNGELTLIPQVTKQVVEFGSPQGYKEKFEKLMVFYDRIIPAKGWNHYQAVNLKYNDQITCY